MCTHCSLLSCWHPGYTVLMTHGLHSNCWHLDLYTHTRTHSRVSLSRKIIRNVEDSTDCTDQMQDMTRYAHLPAACLYACLVPFITLSFSYTGVPYHCGSIHPQTVRWPGEPTSLSDGDGSCSWAMGLTPSWNAW